MFSIAGLVSGPERDGVGRSAVWLNNSLADDDNHGEFTGPVHISEILGLLIGSCLSVYD